MQRMILGDCLDEMRKMEDNSIDCVVCDPPYFLTNNCGSGFMGKSWDSIHDLSRYLWESNTFVNSALKLLSVLQVEKNTEEENIAHPFVCMNLSEEANKQINLVLSAQKLSLSSNVQKKDSALLLVLTKQEALDLLKELSSNHMQIVESFQNGAKENVVFVIPISLLVKELNNIARKTVLQKPKVNDIEVKEILLTSMDQLALQNVIEAMIGMKSEKQFTQETNGLANIALKNVPEKKFNVITSSHIKKEELMTWLTSLLCAINAILSSNTIPNYLIENFYTHIFKQVLRICKPGANLLAFSGTRTVHKLMNGLEKAGFEIFDSVYWIHGQGFPKSLNFKVNGFDGYGTALKPAVEPIVLCRKPIEKTFAFNAEKWKVAGINIDACRITSNEDLTRKCLGHASAVNEGYKRPYHEHAEKKVYGSVNGRWPSNLIFDEEAAEKLDQMSGNSKSPSKKIKGTKSSGGILNRCEGERFSDSCHGDSGGASRFFKCIEQECFLCYNPCTKASKKECKNIYANYAQENLTIIPVTQGNIVQKDVQITPEEQIAQNAKSAENLCDSCAMNIARGLVKIKSSDFKKEELQATLDYIGSFKSSILIQNLVPFAELWENIDTIPTIDSLSILFGSVRHVIENYINQENHRENGKNEQLRFRYCPKASRSERNRGCEGMELKPGGSNAKGFTQDVANGNDRNKPVANFHPTVKPIKLMEYLLKLIMPPNPNAVVLDPFAGSGTTLVAAKHLGFNAIGIEKESEYHAIAEARIAAAKQRPEQLEIAV